MAFGLAQLTSDFRRVSVHDTDSSISGRSQANAHDCGDFGRAVGGSGNFHLFQIGRLTSEAAQASRWSWPDLSVPGVTLGATEGENMVLPLVPAVLIAVGAAAGGGGLGARR